MSRLKTVSPRIQTTRARVAVSSGVAGSARAAKGAGSTARGYGYRWQKAREAFLAENPLCAMCSTETRPVAAAVVDHKTPHGGDPVLFWSKSNWQPLCRKCHDGEKKRSENALRRQGGGGEKSSASAKI